MPVSAIVNYHVTSGARQVYRIDADGIDGELVAPAHVRTEVDVQDVRTEVSVSFESDGLAFVESPSRATSFTEREDWATPYTEDLTALVMERIPAQEVIIFDHTIRVDDPDARRRPARNVHSDYSPQGAHQRLRDILGPTSGRDWETGPFGFVKLWRPVARPIESAPLGFVRPRSVADTDWLLLDLIYPDRVGHIMGLVANPSHEWVYCSRMTPQEVAIFNIYDNRGLPQVAHSAVDLVSEPQPNTRRVSIESRALVRY